MLEKTRKPPARKKTPKPATKKMDSDAALPPAPQEGAPALPPAASEARGRVTQGSPAVAKGTAPGSQAAGPAQRQAPTPGPRTPITAEARWRMIAEAAYFKAQRRGFVGGDARRDWAEAEAEIDAWLLENR